MKYEYKGDATSAYVHLKKLGYDAVLDTSDGELHMVFTKDGVVINRSKMRGEDGAEQYEMYYCIRDFVLGYHALTKAEEIAFKAKQEIGEAFSINVSPVVANPIYTAEQLLSWEQAPYCTGNPVPRDPNLFGSWG